MVAIIPQPYKNHPKQICVNYRKSIIHTPKLAIRFSSIQLNCVVWHPKYPLDTHKIFTLNNKKHQQNNDRIFFWEVRREYTHSYNH